MLFTALILKKHKTIIRDMNSIVKSFLISVSALFVVAHGTDVVILQAGLDYDWTMTSSSANVTIGSSKYFPKITVPYGLTITFQGKTGPYHYFAIRDSSRVVLLDNGVASENKEYRVEFNAPSPGTYTYYCPPHVSSMRGELEIVGESPTEIP